MAKIGTEYGRLGQKRFYNGIFYEEFVPELHGLKGIEAFKEMSNNDAVVGGILYAIEMLIRQCTFTVAPGGNTDIDKKAAEFVEQCMNDMEYTWQDTISEILSFLTYGWSYHEIVYKLRRGKKKDIGLSSKYNDGLIGWKKLPIRSQDTFYEWRYKENSDKLIGMVQCAPPNYGQVLIPIEKALHFTTKSIKANPEGKSILRSAYRAWYFVKRIEEIEGIGIERDLAGFPTLTAPEDLDLWDPDDPEMVRMLSRAQAIVSGIRRDEREGLVLPNGWQLQLLTSGSRRQFDTNQIIDRYHKEIATSVLADFVLLGQSAVGSFALADSKTQMFSLAVGTYLDTICEVFNNQGIRRLIDINGKAFEGITDYPKMQHSDIEQPDLTAFATYLKTMIDAQIITPDPELERYVRQVGKLPEKVERPIENTAKPEAEDEKVEGATMYKIQSALSKYIRGEFPRDLSKEMLLGIGISEERAEEYLQTIDRNHQLTSDGQTVIDGEPKDKAKEDSVEQAQEQSQAVPVKEQRVIPRRAAGHQEEKLSGVNQLLPKEVIEMVKPQDEPQRDTRPEKTEEAEIPQDESKKPVIPAEIRTREPEKSSISQGALKRENGLRDHILAANKAAHGMSTERERIERS